MTVRPGRRPGHVWIDGRIEPADGAAPVRLRPRLPARRRRLRDAPGPVRPPDRAGRAPRPPAPLGRRPGIPLPADAGARDRARDRRAPRGRGARRAGRRRVGPDHGEPGHVPAAAASCRPARTSRRRSSSRPGRSTPPPADHLERGLHLIASAVRRDPENPLAALKTTSRADYVYARLEARRAGADDALFLTVDGYLSEGTSANVFLVRGDELATPALACAILPGTTRSWILGWGARVGLRPTEGWLTTRDLAEADEAFLCSSVAGILPVTRFAGAPIGTGAPGPWTRRARADREAFIRRRMRTARDRRHDPGRARRPDPPARRRGRAAGRHPVARCPPALAPAVGRPARRGLGLDGSLPPRLAHGRQVEEHRPGPADDAGRGGRLRPRGRRGQDRRPPDEPRRGRAPGHAVPRRGGRRGAGPGDGPRCPTRPADERARPRAHDAGRRRRAERARCPTRSPATTSSCACGSTSTCPGFVDAYFGPADLKAQVELEPLRPAARLREDAAALRERVGSAEVDDPARRRWLAAQLAAIDAQLRALAGDPLPYADHVAACFDLRMARRPDAVYAAAAGPARRAPAGRRARWPTGWRPGTPGSSSRRPGSAPSSTGSSRVVRERAGAPVRPAAGRGRCAVGLVTDQPWSGYNWYDGGLRSRVDINTDLPIHGQAPGRHDLPRDVPGPPPRARLEGGRPRRRARAGSRRAS